MSVNAAQAEEMITKNQGNAKFVIVDVRSEGERKAGYIANSILVPLGDVEQRIGEFKKENTYLVYCRSGARSDAACQILKKYGIYGINLAGGIIGWGNRPTLKY